MRTPTRSLEAALDTKNVSFNANLFVRASRTAFMSPSDDIHAGAEDALNQTATLVGIKTFKPTDPVEAMIAAQAVMLHDLAMQAVRRARLPQQRPDAASKPRKDAANSARAMVDMAEALDRRRGKGPQVIRVEKMLVTDGGQAVAGNVTSGTPSVTSRAARQDIGQGTPPATAAGARPPATSGAWCASYGPRRASGSSWRDHPFAESSSEPCRTTSLPRAADPRS